MMVAQVVGLTPGDFVHTIGDLDLYNPTRGDFFPTRPAEIHMRNRHRLD